MFNSPELEELDEVQTRLVTLAILDKNFTLLEALVENRKNKNPYMDIKKKQTLLHYMAWKKDDVQLFEIMANKVHFDEILNSKDSSGEYMVDVAARRGNVAIVKYIGNLVNTLVYFKKYTQVEDWVGLNHLKNAFIISGEGDEYSTFSILMAFLVGMNEKEGKKDKFLKFLNESKPRFPNRILDMIPGFLNFTDSFDENKPVENEAYHLVRPFNIFIFEIIEVCYKAKETNGDMKNINLVSITEKYLNQTIQLIDKDMAFEDSPKVYTLESIDEIQEIMIYLQKAIRRHKKRFHKLFKEFIVTSVEHNEARLEDVNEESMENFRLQKNKEGMGKFAGQFLVHYCIDLWKTVFPNSELDTFVRTFMTETEINVEVVIGVIEGFLHSSTTSIVTYINKSYKIDISNPGLMKQEL